jgi:hypothetical protein
LPGHTRTQLLTGLALGAAFVGIAAPLGDANAKIAPGVTWGTTVPDHWVTTNGDRTKLIGFGSQCIQPGKPVGKGGFNIVLPPKRHSLAISKNGIFSATLKHYHYGNSVQYSDMTIIVSGKFSKKTTRFHGHDVSSSVTYSVEVPSSVEIVGHGYPPMPETPCDKVTYTVKLRK